MKNLLLQLFTWWNGQTLGTRFFTWRFGKKVGQDEFGNIYYEGSMSSYGLPRRWVVYNGYAEASAIPPGWHGWMHHRTNVAPPQEDYKAREWETLHKPNLTVHRAPIAPRDRSPHRANALALPAITTPGHRAAKRTGFGHIRLIGGRCAGWRIWSLPGPDAEWDRR